jgi:hypothetical protein
VTTCLRTLHVAVVTVLLGSCFLGGCSGGSGGKKAAAPGHDAPQSIVIAPTGRDGGADAGANQSGLANADADGRDDTLPLEIAINASLLCLRLAGRVYCTTDAAPERALDADAPLHGIEDAVSLALGDDFGCAVTRRGTVFCFGDNDDGQLGAGLRAERMNDPIQVSGITNARRVSAGAAHACALLADGTVTCWGQNALGQTGSKTRYLAAARELVVPEVVAGVRDVVTIAAGTTTTCATTQAHALTCWGRVPLGGDVFGNDASSSPKTLPSLFGIDLLSRGGNAFCGIRSGEVVCWGELSYLLPAKDRQAGAIVPIGVKNARRLRVGLRHACAVMSDGGVTCWGINDNGSLGRGTSSSTTDPLEPAPVAGLTAAAIDVAVGGEMSCAVTTSPSPGRAYDVYCWGWWPHSAGGRRESHPIEMRFTR